MRGLVASRVGRDPLGEELLVFLESKGLDTSLIQQDEIHPTGQVTVDLSDEGHPDYIIHEQAAWDFLAPAPALLEAASRAAAVCFGTLAQRSAISREAIHTVLAACTDECLIVYDVNSTSVNIGIGGSGLNARSGRRGSSNSTAKRSPRSRPCWIWAATIPGNLPPRFGTAMTSL
jgi:sugar/nucleoside kinase (ribokinase family)